MEFCVFIFILSAISPHTTGLRALLNPFDCTRSRRLHLLTYKAIHFSQPPYLSALIRRSDLTRGSRLSISSSKQNKRSGLHSFIVGAPTEWNKIPQAIRTIESISGFRKQLKTYLFRLAYPPP